MQRVEHLAPKCRRHHGSGVPEGDIAQDARPIFLELDVPKLEAGDGGPQVMRLLASALGLCDLVVAQPESNHV